MKNKKLTSNLLPFFWYFIVRYPFSFAIFFVAPIIQVLEVTLVPYALKLILEGIENSTDRVTIFSDISYGISLFALSWIILIAVARSQNFWQGYIIPKFQSDIRSEVMEYLTGHSFTYFSEKLSGNLANKVADLARSLEAIRMKISWNIISTLAVIIASAIIIYFVSPIFSYLMIGFFIFGLAIALYFSPKINITSRQNAEDVSIINGTIVDILANIMPVKLFASRRNELNNLEVLLARERESNKQQIILLNIYRLFMDILLLVMLAILLYLLIYQWQVYKITTAEFVFIFTINIGVLNTLWYFNEGMPDLFADIGIARQALAIIMVPHGLVDKDNAKPLVVQKGEVIFDNVTFGYKRDENVFEDKQIIIPAGQKVGLVGYSGSGKSTFVNLILRFYDIDKGCILIDGQDIADVTQESLRNNISVIPQDTSLFHRTLLENIRYGNPEASDADVISASKDAHCHGFIEDLPLKYQTLVGERGVKLSGGQRQRIAIARSMLKKSPILILDEATSALDSLTEKHIQDSMEELMIDRTTIIVAHRLSTLAKMDRILVFDEGEIIEDGTHEELVELGGHYSIMWRMQAGGFMPDKKEQEK